VLATQADVVPSDNFLIACHRHSGSNVTGGGGGEVFHFLKKARRGAGWHLFCNRRREGRKSGDPRVRLVIDIYCPLVAILRENARHHFVKGVATLAATAFKV
jgi:hypothetical protein